LYLYLVLNMFSLTSKLVLGLLGATSAYTTAKTPGAGVSVSQVGLNNAKDVVTPLLFAVLKNLTIPEVDFDGGYLKDIQVHLD